MKKIFDKINTPIPVIGMIHMAGVDDESAFKQAKEEIDIYIKSDVDAVLVETYFGSYNRVERVLSYLNKEKIIPYGVNCLNVDAMGFELAIAHDCDFIQIDSVIGHVVPRDEPSLQAFFKLYRSRTTAKLLGGVRFKYQPVKSEKTVEEDLILAKERCDVICVTQDATGEETSLTRIKEFRKAIKDFPLFVCAGITADNIDKQLPYMDGMVIGSFFKDTYHDSGKVCKEHVDLLMDKVKKYRKEHFNE